MSRPELLRKRIGHLETLELKRSTAKDDGALNIVFFHGFGADMHDLAPLSGAVQAGKDTNWYFPNGPHTVPIGPHSEGRAWFPISLAELEKTIGAGAIDLSRLTPPGLKKSRELATDFLEKLDVPMNRLVIGGFSQGAMLATDVVMNLSEPPRALVILSGTLVHSERWTRQAAQHPGYPFFQSHGVNDPVLSFAMAKRLHDLIVQAGWQGPLRAFHGGHEIPSEVLIQLGEFLRKLSVAPNQRS